MSKKIIAVAGATGAQGGGLVRAILERRASEFAVRALTRKTDSEKAKELANLGADVVAANFDSVADLKRARRRVRRKAVQPAVAAAGASRRG